MNKKAILIAGATVGAVAGAVLLAKKKGWNPLNKNGKNAADSMSKAKASNKKQAAENPL